MKNNTNGVVTITTPMLAIVSANVAILDPKPSVNSLNIDGIFLGKEFNQSLI